MENLERDEGRRQILALHHKLHPDAISYMASRTLVTSRFCFVVFLFYFFSRRTVLDLFIFTFMNSERESVQWKLDSLHYLFFPIAFLVHFISATLASMDKTESNLGTTYQRCYQYHTHQMKKKSLWRNRSKKLISLVQLCYITGVLLVFSKS